MASRDFLSGFGREARMPSSEDKAGGSEEIDKLRLGLSLGGCFGTGPTMPEAKRQCLPRSSSTAAVCTLPGEDLATTAEPLPPPLHRTSSLPTEHKRLERRNSMNSGRSDAQEPSEGFPLRRASSNMPEQGGSGGAEYTRSSSAMNTSSDNSSGPPLLPPTTTMRTASSTGDFRKTTAMMQEEMPMVFSRLGCPNARRVDGFLYKLGKAANDDVRIVCVCHGNFLTPAEFVRHAGGGVDDLAHPLRHIVINKQPSEFL